MSSADEDGLAELLQSLTVNEFDAVAMELEALEAIYGEGTIGLFYPSHSAPSSLDGDALDRKGAASALEEKERPRWTPGEKLRIDVQTTLPEPYPDVPLHLLVTLPPTYPDSSPPQLQLLSRYIGPHGVDSALFGAVLRIYISSTDGVEWTPGDVAVYDGVENVRERCGRWFGERKSEELAGEMMREEEYRVRVEEHAAVTKVAAEEAEAAAPPARRQEEPSSPAELPDGLIITSTPPIIFNKSTFVGHAVKLTSPGEVPLVLNYLLSDRKIAKATHPIINAWRCDGANGVVHQDNDDDGENAAGGRLAHLLQILDITNVLVVVTRWYGGIHLGPDRFKLINQAARDALELGGFLDAPEPAGGKSAGKAGKGKGGKSSKH